ncbi:hypothetical protein D910_12213 [Dendroctonus ponderosae]|uniref:HTH CENPB-type domain-containing protein n=1 Tax=Dendroctonus ponderosae TaxID=77166 RepID=U4UX87_DENPD|nr:hypothetical protein D910_12213 [Dendroctonus ponderosae]
MGSKIKHKEFVCSRSWVERFKKRHNISSGKIVGESAGVNMNMVNDYEPDDEIPLNEWLEKHKDSDYEYDSDEDVHNFAEEQVKTKLSDFNFFEYVSIDNGIVKREMLTDEQIIDSITSSTALSNNEEDDDLSETDSTLDTNAVPTISEMTKKVSETRNFLQSRQVPNHIWESFCDLENYINNIYFCSRNVQRKIFEKDFMK